MTGAKLEQHVAVDAAPILLKIAWYCEVTWTKQSLSCMVHVFVGPPLSDELRRNSTASFRCATWLRRATPL
jgi:hypothetical protein